jgi:hypothetical protein
MAGCANQAVTRSGFLDQYDALSTAPGDDSARTYVSSSATARTGSRVVIDEVELRLPPSQAGTLAPDLLDQARADYRAALKAAFAKRYIVVDDAGSDEALRVRAAITGIKPSNPALNTATFLLVGPVSNGGVSTESEVIDASTGQRVAAQATFTNGHLFNGGLGGYFDQLGHVRAAFEMHAEKLRDLTLDDAGAVPATR